MYADRSILPVASHFYLQPKTYFAAERTFIQWISAALLLMTVAAVLLSISDAKKVESSYVTGVILTVLAIVVTVYALVVYFRRLYLLEHAKQYGYSDQIGPAVLTLAVASGIAASLYFAISLHAPIAISTAAVIPEPGKCMRHGFTGISLLEYQPSDVVVDEVRNMFIVPSQSKLTAIPMEISETPSELQVLTELAGDDMEAVTYVDGILYAVSEGKISSELLAFTWRPVSYGVDEEVLKFAGRSVGWSRVD
jgi:uncharacterized membrane protein YidH (DUF202 family)